MHHDEFKTQSIYFGTGTEENPKASNKTRTSKYTWYSFLALSLLYQFTRVANIYFLIISILTTMPFSPKSPGSMIGTFSAVLIFTMFKELFEDYFRMKADYEINNTKTLVLNFSSKQFEKIAWKDIKLGDVIKIRKDETFPCDLLFIHAREEVVFVDTMNLDGETNLKPKTLASIPLKEFIQEGLSESMADVDTTKQDIDEHLQDPKSNKYAKNLLTLYGSIECGLPNENLEKWDGTVKFSNLPGDKQTCFADIDNMLLRG